MRGAIWWIAGMIPLGVGVAAIAYVAALPAPEARLAGYATRMTGRTPAQRHNALLSARSLDGAVIAPHGSFSFNRTVKTWTVDRGYVRAPVSYDGELVPAFGGGVCQTSTTLYNTALLAGMEITERHHHVFAPHYIPAGRDAAVAYPNIDLRFTNPYPFAVRVRARVEDDALRVELWGRRPAQQDYVLVSRVLATTPPERLIRQVTARSDRPTVARYAGIDGCRVVTYRVTRRHGREVARERLSDDSYPAMPNILAFTEPD